MSLLSNYIVLKQQQQILDERVKDIEKHPFYRAAAAARELLDGRKAHYIADKDREFQYAYTVGSSHKSADESMWAAEFPEFVKCVPAGECCYRVEFKW